MNEQIQAGLEKLDSGGWSLTIDGFARKALKLKAPMGIKEKRLCREAMISVFGQPRQVRYGQGHIEVWDYQK